MRRVRSRRRMLLAAVAATAIAATALPAAAQTPEERRLAETQARLDEIHADIEAASAERDRNKSEFAKADARVDEVLKAVSQAKLSVERQQRAVEQAKEELTELGQAARVQQRLTRQRVVRIYQQGTGVPFASVLASGDAQEALDRSSLISVVARSDRRTIEAVTASRVAVDAQREVLVAEKAALTRVLEQRRQLLAQVEEIRKERAIALSESASRLEDLQQQEEHLQSESRRLAAIARRASQALATASRSSPSNDGVAAPAADVPPPVSGGGWSWPASGPVTSGFGWRWGRAHEGIDIGAPTGAPVVAARAGSVIHAGTMGGYGLLILVDHGDGTVTAYAHHSAIHVGVGQQVTAGQQLGAVGTTGNVTGPHLHFEVRVNGVPQDPQGYLP